MRNLLLNTAAFSADTIPGSNAPGTIAPTSDTATPAPVAPVTKPVKPARAKRVAKPAAKATKRAVTAKPDTSSKKPAREAPAMHAINATYTGASPTIRNSTGKLSAIDTTIGASNFTYRDDTFLRDIAGTYNDKTFSRLNADAGNVRRAIAHGVLRHVSGDLGTRDCKLAVTPFGLYLRGALKRLVPGDHLPAASVIEYRQRMRTKPVKPVAPGTDAT